MPLERALLSIPFAKGISQREAPEYLAPGSSVTAQNAVHPKINRFAKRPGRTLLTAAGKFAGSATTAGPAATLSGGRRLATFRGQLVAIGPDANWTDAIWVYDDTSNQPVLLDRMPEVYCFPPEFISGVSAPAASVLTRAWQMDQAVVNGYEVSVWSIQADSAANTIGIYYAVRNAATGEMLEPPQLLIVQGPGSSPVDVPKLTVCGTYVVLTYSTGNGDYNIYGTTKNMAAVGNPWLAPVRLNIGNGDASVVATGLTAPYDVAFSVGEPTKLAIVYCRNNSGTLTISLNRIDVTGGVLAHLASAIATSATWTSDSTPSPAAFALRADEVNNELAVTWTWVNGSSVKRVAVAVYGWPTMSNVATAVELFGTPGPLATNDGTNTIAIALERLNTATYKVLFSTDGATFDNGSTVDPYIAAYILVESGGAMTIAAHQPRVTWGISLWSRMALVNGVAYVIGHVPSQEQGSFFLLSDDAFADVTGLNGTPDGEASYSPMRLVANLSVRQSNLLRSTIEGQSALQSRVVPHLPANAYAAGTEVYQSVIPMDSGPTSCAPARVQWDYFSSLNFQSCELGQNTMFAGGCPSGFDGAQQFELGFPVYPWISAVASGSGSVTGTYEYIAVYQWVDARGQTHLSARSIAVSVSPSSNTQVLLTAGVCGFSSRIKSPNAAPQPGSTTVGPQANLPRRRDVMVYWYRTTNAGSFFYQLGAPQVAQPGQATVTYTDAFLADAVLQTHPQLYGDGSNGAPGNLDVECPPAFQCMITHQNRLFGVDGSNLWSSKAFTEFEGSGFNEQMNVSVDDGPGVITALASMDGNLIIFKRDRLLTMSGLGPADDGGSNDWSPPQRIASDTGCVDWRSVVTTSKGTYFMSPRGLRLLTRDLQVMPVLPPEGELAVNPFVTSAILHPTLDRFILTANVSDAGFYNSRNGESLDRDDVIDSWTTAVAADVAGQGAVGAAIANVPVNGQLVSTYHALRGTGGILRDSSTSYLDPSSSFVSMVYESAWVRAEGIAGFSRFRRLMLTWQSADPHQLSVYVAYDYAPSGDQPTYYLIGTVTASQMAAMTTPACQAIFQLPRQRAEAVRFKIVDASDSSISPTTGQGPVLMSMDLEVSVYPNKRLGRVSAAQRS